MTRGRGWREEWATKGQEGPGGEPEVRPRNPKALVKLFKSPEGFPTEWRIPVSEKAYLVDGRGNCCIGRD